MSESFNDPDSYHNSLPEAAQERRRQTARDYAAKVRELAPKVPDRPWSRDELRTVFLAEDTLLSVSILLNRNYNDVATASKALTKTYNEEPQLLSAWIELTHVQARIRAIHEVVETHVCKECFTRPHQFTCSQAQD